VFDEVVAWVESAQEEEVSGVFSLEGIDENQGIYRVSLIKEIGLSDKSIDLLAGERFQELIKKSRTAISAVSELSSEDRDWLISETALQLR
jgi:hypothetical protein